jgi:KDO2-lipid IV(A) lauroyltransferase
MVDVTGLHNIEAALALGRGAIVVTPHFGNWDLAAARAVVEGFSVTAVTERFGTDSLNRRVIQSRQRAGVTVVPVGVTAGKTILSALRRNEVVALVCDLPGPGRNVTVRICGQTASVPAGPALLALRSAAPIVPILCRRLPDDRHRLEIKPALSLPRQAGTDAGVEAVAQAILDCFEADLRATPEQWYLFSRMWQEQPKPAAEQPVLVGN